MVIYFVVMLTGRVERADCEPGSTRFRSLAGRTEETSLQEMALDIGVIQGEGDREG